MEQFDLSNIAEAVIEEMVITNQLPRAHSAKVLSAILSKHRHQHQMHRGLRRSSSVNLAAFFGVDNKATPLKATEQDGCEVKKASPVCEAKENVADEAARPRTTSDASSQTPFSTLDYLEKVRHLIQATKHFKELHEREFYMGVSSTLMFWSNENKSCMRVDKREFA